MLKFNRLRGGASALATAAAALVNSDEEQPNPAADAQAGEPNAGAPGPDDADVPPDVSAEQQPAGNAQQPPAPAAAEPAPDSAPQGEPLNLTAEQRQHFEAGAAARDMAVATVFASEHAKGREAAAAELLAGGYAADKIIATLQKLPKGSAGADAMLKSLSETPNPKIDAGGEQEAAKAQNYGWGKAHKKAASYRGRGRK